MKAVVTDYALAIENRKKGKGIQRYVVAFDNIVNDEEGRRWFAKYLEKYEDHDPIVAIFLPHGWERLKED